MAVDELQAIIQRCVSSFLSLEVTSVSSVISLHILELKPKLPQNTSQLLELFMGQLSSASMFHWLLCGAYPKMLGYFCFLEMEVFLYLGTKAGSCRKHIFQRECCSLDLVLLKYCLVFCSNLVAFVICGKYIKVTVMLHLILKWKHGFSYFLIDFDKYGVKHSYFLSSKFWKKLISKEKILICFR